jgi:peptidoglycan-associated lipoprotein
LIKENAMRKSSSLAMMMASVVLFTACSSVPLDERKAAPIEDRTAQRDGAAGATPGGIDPRSVSTVNTTSPDGTMQDAQGLLAKRVIYFDLDSYIIKDEYQPVVEAHASHLRNDRNRRVILQGHTDERGSREYNLALGQKRAEAVRKAMSLLGVADNQMEAISFGEEKPTATGSEETAWAENRRTEIIY